MQNPTSGVLRRTKWTRSVEVSARSPLKRGDFSSNRHLALGYWWSMIFSENRSPLFGIMLQLPNLSGAGYGLSGATATQPRYVERSCEGLLCWQRPWQRPRPLEHCTVMARDGIGVVGVFRRVRG